MQLVSFCRELFFSYWWCDWVKASNKDCEGCDTCMDKYSLHVHAAGDSDAEALCQAKLDRKLLIAAREGQVTRANRLLRHGANIHCIGNYGRTPIHFAAQNCHKDMIELLLRARAKINAEDGNGNTPLHHAASSPYRKAGAEDIEMLIQAGGSVAYTNLNGETPLHKARSEQVVEALVRAGADVNCWDRNAQTPLHKTSRPDVAAALLRAGADVNNRDQRDLTPLYLLWQTRGIESAVSLTKIFVEAGADINESVNVRLDFIADSDNGADTLAAWIERHPPRMRCTYPFGPSRSMRAAHARRVAAHAEVLAFLKARNGEQGKN